MQEGQAPGSVILYTLERGELSIGSRLPGRGRANGSIASPYVLGQLWEGARPEERLIAGVESRPWAMMRFATDGGSAKVRERADQPHSGFSISAITSFVVCGASR